MLTGAFRRGLSEAGYVDGENVTIAERYADGHPERIPELVSDLVGLPVDVLLSLGGRPSHAAAKQATTTVPIVFATVDAVLQAELMAPPSSNLTGVRVPTTIHRHPKLDYGIRVACDQTACQRPSRFSYESVCQKRPLPSVPATRI